MKFYKVTFLSILAACFVLTISRADRASTNNLIIGSWGGSYQKAQQEALFHPFNQNHPVAVIDKEYSGSLADLRRAARRTGEFWDVVQVEEAELKVGCQEEGKYQLFQPIKWDKITTKDNLIDAAKSKCGVGAIKWSMIMSYNKAKYTQNTPKNWVDFWNVKQFPGKRGLRKTAKFTMEIALLAAGVPKSEIYTKLGTDEGVSLALKKLEELAPHIAWWESGEQPAQWLATNHVAMTTAYSGRIALANQGGRDFALVWQDNLSEMDFWAIIKSSKKEKEAHTFISYVTDEAQQTKLTELIPYGPTNKEALKTIENLPLKAQLPTSPENQKLSLAIGTDFWNANGKNIAKSFQKWLKNYNKPKPVTLPEPAAPAKTGLAN